LAQADRETGTEPSIKQRYCDGDANGACDVRGVYDAFWQA
jgi:hypothetical protein